MKYLCLGWHPQSSWLHETKVFSGESGSYEIGHLSSTPIVFAQHSTSRPYLFYNLSNAYTGLDSRIISTRLGGLRKLGASMTSPCLDTVLSKLYHKKLLEDYHKKLLEDYHKKLLKVYHEEMGDAAAMPLPDEDDKNYTTKQHYTGLFRMSQVNHIQDGEKESSQPYNGEKESSQSYTRWRGHYSASNGSKGEIRKDNTSGEHG
ncbi:uncharacterized protein EAE98_002649 [Botrytis deweyae]|uniref:Uncharacterized protein n=1 Tax=Botrytis deweyae TaxID=2478750 RepID=A0ABQ7IXS2_9HELO|nr:uncharacterized protein EAE98_002649 [Botrytis deweyae]KAF7936430.1 hypothetical protein EAE98_002649 [Botrytis deweyae]